MQVFHMTHKEISEIKNRSFEEGLEIGRKKERGKIREERYNLPIGVEMIVMTAQEHHELKELSFKDGRDSILGDSELVIYHKSNLDLHDRKVKHNAFNEGLEQGRKEEYIKRVGFIPGKSFKKGYDSHEPIIRGNSLCELKECIMCGKCMLLESRR